jgi:low temperature requirement protein LtrA
VTQVTEVIDHHPGVAGTVQGLLILIVLFWMYAGFTWLANAMGTDGLPQRLTVLAGMAALLVCSQAVPEAFGSSGIAMGIGFLALTLFHLVGYAWLAGGGGARAIWQIAPMNVGGALMILAAGWTAGAWDWVLWGTPAVLFMWTLLRSRGAGGFDVRTAHFAERHGLMIIIVLGESLISVGLAAQAHHLDPSLIVGCLVGFMAIVGLWWAYFVGDDEVAAEHFAAADPDQQSWMARMGYDLTHLLMIAGVIGVAAGTRLGLDDLWAPAESAAAWLIGGGAAVYVAGTGLFRSVLHVGPIGGRLVGTVVLLGTVGIGVSLGTAEQLGAVAVVLALTLALGTRTGLRAVGTAH